MFSISNNQPLSGVFLESGTRDPNNKEERVKKRKISQIDDSSVHLVVNKKIRLEKRAIRIQEVADNLEAIDHEIFAPKNTKMSRFYKIIMREVDQRRTTGYNCNSAEKCKFLLTSTLTYSCKIDPLLITGILNQIQDLKLEKEIYSIVIHLLQNVSKLIKNSARPITSGQMIKFTVSKILSKGCINKALVNDLTELGLHHKKHSLKLENLVRNCFYIVLVTIRSLFLEEISKTEVTEVEFSKIKTLLNKFINNKECSIVGDNWIDPWAKILFSDESCDTSKDVTTISSDDIDQAIRKL